MTIAELKDYLWIAQVLGLVLVPMFAFWLRNSFVPRSQYETQQAVVGERLAQAEKSVASCARSDQLTGLQRQIDGLAADQRVTTTTVQALDNTLERVSAGVTRIEDFLLNSKVHA